MSLSPKDGGKKAAAAVVGFQMPITSLHQRLLELASSTNPRMNCSNDWMDCYLLDQNGYVVISEAHKGETGQFMGTQEGAIMVSMVSQGLYNPVEVYDYQAWCRETVSNKLFVLKSILIIRSRLLSSLLYTAKRFFSFYNIYVVTQRVENAASILTEPLQYVKRLLIWFLLRLVWLATQCVNLSPGIYGKIHLDEDAPDPPPPPKPYLYHYPCDQKRTLYMMNSTVAAKGVANHPDYCSRPFYAQKVSDPSRMIRSD